MVFLSMPFRYIYIESPNYSAYNRAITLAEVICKRSILLVEEIPLNYPPQPGQFRAA